MSIWETLVKVASFAAGILLMISYVPQIMTLYKEKTAEGISMSFWIVLDLSLLMLFILALNTWFNTGDASLAISQGLNLFLALIVTCQVVIYKKKDKQIKKTGVIK